MPTPIVLSSLSLFKSRNFSSRELEPLKNFLSEIRNPFRPGTCASGGAGGHVRFLNGTYNTYKLTQSEGTDYESVCWPSTRTDEVRWSSIYRIPSKFVSPRYVSAYDRVIIAPSRASCSSLEVNAS